MRTAKHCVLVLYRWQRYRARYARARPLGSVDDFRRRLVQYPVVVGLQSNSYLLIQHRFPLTSDRHRSGLSKSPTFEPATCNYSRISLIVPAPTVRPPSRIANLSPFSIAIGVINWISSRVLSPGITISTPSGNCDVPVTSVVLK